MKIKAGDKTETGHVITELQACDYNTAVELSEDISDSTITARVADIWSAIERGDDPAVSLAWGRFIFELRDYQELTSAINQPTPAGIELS